VFIIHRILPPARMAGCKVFLYADIAYLFFFEREKRDKIQV